MSSSRARRLALVAGVVAAGPISAQEPTVIPSPSTIALASIQNSKPQPLSTIDTIPAPRDIPYPGVMTLDIDATDVERGIFTTHETLPVAGGGHMVLQFPKWLPGNHSPSGEIDKLAGLHIRARGKELDWTRDAIDVYSFHIDVPQGTSVLDIDLQFTSATKSDQGFVVTSPVMLRLQPNSMSLYPAGYFTRQIPVKMTVKYPEGFTAASALPSKASGSTYTYDATDYEVLVDSPILAGRFCKAFELTPRVTLDTCADMPDQLVATPEQIAAHTRLVEQAAKAFGAQHYDHYHFLLSISDLIGGGLEHHRSSEDGVSPGYFTEWDANIEARNLLPHEFTHSWNGKFRRGVDLWTPTFNVPMRDSSLWVYEGQTTFWSYVLQARSGLVSKQDTLDQLATVAALSDTNPARHWRDLVDTTNDSIMLGLRRPRGWTSWQRSRDYYFEGMLVWFEIDSLLREKSGGSKSIDDFARAFFGSNDGDWGVMTYTLDDIVATLNGIAPYDWKALITTRLTEHAAGAPLSGLARNGYRLIFTDTPSPTFRQGERASRTTDFTYSLGFVANPTGDLLNVLWDGPAFKKGLAAGDTIVGVNGTTYSDERMKAAIMLAKGSKDPIHVLVKAGAQLRDITIDYHGGPRYPHLEKIGTGETGLDRLLTAK